MDIISFPNEVLCQILFYNEIEISDLHRLMLTCHRFHNLIRNSNEIWRQKFMIRWPRLYNDLRNTENELPWLEMVALRLKVVKDVEKALDNFSAVSYPIGQPPIKLIDKLILGDSSFALSSQFVEDELLELIYHPMDMLNENLTSKFYANQVLGYVRRCRLQTAWQKFKAKPESEISLLEGAMLISQWGQIDQEHLTSLSKVETILEGIAQRVRQLADMKRGAIDTKTATEDPRIVRKILNYLNQVLYDEMGFQGNKEEYYAHNNSYIDKVLQTRRGIPITLCIIYHEVAKRLGIQCEPVSFPQHFLLRWREHPHREAADSYTFIDAFNNGASHQPRSCPALIGQPRPNVHREAYSAVPADQVFQRMVNNLIQCSRVHDDRPDSRRDDQRLRNQLHFSRLACVISPGQTPSVVAYAELCAFLGVQLEEAIQLLLSDEFSDEWTRVDFEPGHWERVRQITYTKCARKLSEQQSQTKNTVACHRPSSMRYAVGLVMRYSVGEELLRRTYICVIVSWDAKCQASDEWIGRMTRNLIRGRDQPFYYVLTEDGNAGYVAEDHLELHPGGAIINHADVGLHFEYFDGRRYIPNCAKRTEYPEDEAVALSLIEQR